MSTLHTTEGNASEACIALTFDDGPSAWTEPILDILAANNASATFFVIGSLVETRSACAAEDRRGGTRGRESLLVAPSSRP